MNYNKRGSEDKMMSEEWPVQPEGAIPPEETRPEIEQETTEDTEREEEPQAEPHSEEGEVEIEIVVPEKLAQEILLTARYLYDREYKKFIAHRDNNPKAKLLNPDRVKTEREERDIDQLVEEKIQASEAENRNQALDLLYREHIYAPEIVQRYLSLINGLGQRKSINISFLEQQLQSRREHEDGMFRGESPNWRGPQPPTKKQKKGFEQERDKMDRFLTQLGQVRRGE